MPAPDPETTLTAPRPQGAVANFLSLLTGNAAVQCVNLAYLTVAARLLGKEAIGVYSFLIAIHLLLLVVVSFGREMIVTRETTGATADRRHALLEEAWLHHLLMGTLAALAFTLAALWVPRLTGRVAYVALAASTLVLVSPATAIRGFFRGVKRMAVCSLADVVHVVSRAAVGLVLIAAGFGVASIFWAFAVSSVCFSVFLLVAYYRHAHRLLRPALHGEHRVLLKDGGQVAGAHLTSGVFNRFDWVFLGSLKTAAVLGVYSLAYRFFEVVLRVPGIMALSAFPYLCGQEKGDNRSAQVRLALKLAVLPGCLVIALAFWWAEPMVILVLGPDYREVALLLVVLTLSLPFHGGCGLFYHLTIARHRQRYLVLTSGSTAAVNVLLCVALIPPLGGLGAALAMLAPSVLQYFLLGLAANERRLLLATLLHALRATLIAALISTLVWCTHLHWIVAVFLTAAVVTAAFWYVGGFTASEKQLLRRVVSRWIPRQVAARFVRDS